MESSKQSHLEILYKKKKLLDFYYGNETRLKELKEFTAQKYFLPLNEIKFQYDKKLLEDDSLILSKILITSLPSFTNTSESKIKVKILPLIHMEIIFKKVKLIPLDEPEYEKENFLVFEFDFITTTIKEFQKEIQNLLIKKLEDLNYRLDNQEISECEFFDDPVKENFLFDMKQNNSSSKADDSDFRNNLVNQYFKFNEKINFYFLIKNSKIVFYNNSNLNINNTRNFNSISNDNDIQEIILKKNCESGIKFPVIIQTYNGIFTELEVYPEMIILELKELIEDSLNIQKDFQELLYLVYKLKDDSKMLKEYYIRPKGIIFLRGFYFPLVFCDYYEKSIKNIIGMNIAQKVSNIKFELVRRLNLNFENFCLISNGRELSNEKSLIDYNVQRMQTIYMK